jgi:adenylate cyclase class IV
MGREYEAKFLDIDVEEVRKKLKSVGASIVHKEQMLKRTVFTLCDDQIKGYSRVRDDGDGVSMTTKIYNDPKFPEEYEVHIKEDYDTGVNFMKSIGMRMKARQESKREKWKHDLAHEITFDTIPGLPTYMEVDCESEDKLNELISLLKLDKSKMYFGAFDIVFEHYYGIEPKVINEKTPSLTFGNIIKEISPKKNHDLLKELAESYTKQSSKKQLERTKKTSKKKAK